MSVSDLPAVPSRSPLRAHIAIARPDHWFKNGFMLLGVLLAVSYQPGVLAEGGWWRLAVAVAATCLIASSNYVLNEILDAPHDRFHPLKRTRPIPAGEVSVSLAWAEWIGLAVAGGALAWSINTSFFASAVWLWMMGILYNMPPVRTKEWPYLDVLSESVNNPIRLLLGWFALIDATVPPISLALSYWMAGAYLMATKRYAEYRHIGNPDVAASYRRSFRHYSEERLLVSMFFYAVAAALFGGIFILRYHLELILSVPAVAGLFAYYLQLGMLADSPAQRPEALYRHRGFMTYLTVCFVLFVTLLFIRIPRLYDWLEVEPTTMRPLWTFGQDMLPGSEDTTAVLDRLARRYVVLVLTLGAHDSDAVDAYYGPAELQAEAREAPLALEALAREVDTLRTALSTRHAGVTGDSARRLQILGAHTRALRARIAVVAGQRLPFDEESRRIYDAVAPSHDGAHFDRLLASLDASLEGGGPVAARYDRFRERFIIPPERVDAVFRAAIEACRARTREHVTLPESEELALAYVTNKPWSGYNWYQGGYRSRIEVNTDLPIHIDRALDLACHEGYPGHHVYNVLLEQNLVRERGWVEWSVYPLFSPQSLIAEGTANFGIEVAFPDDARTAFERDVLFPLAGLDPAYAARYREVQTLAAQLSYAGNEAARRYLDGHATAAQASEWLVRYALMSPERATQRVRFFERYRSYVINYNLGEDLVEAYVNAHGGTAAHPERRWEVFTDLLRVPRLPSELSSRRTRPTVDP